jgi:hypothetical protein
VPVPVAAARRLGLGAVTALLAPSDFPGSSADASAASAAVSAAAAANIHRRVRLILASVASRASTAGAGFRPAPAVLSERPMVAMLAKTISFH